MKNKVPNYKEVYQFPLHMDSFCSLYVYSNNKVMTFEVLSENAKKIKEIIDVINGLSNKTYEKVSYSDEVIHVDNEPMFLIRGWGHLTCTGGLGLKPKDAAHIQDSFCNFVVDKLLNGSK